MILSTVFFFRPKEAIIVAITKTKSSTIAFIFSLLLLSSSPLFLFLPWCDFGANISCISSGPTRSTEPAFRRLFTQMTVKFVTFLKKTAAVRCFQLRKKVLRLDATSYQSSDRTVQHLCLWLQNEHEWQFCEEFALHPGGTNDNDAHACEPNYITVQNKIIAKILPVNKFKTLKFLSLLPSMSG